ncbi:DUF2267 domain-containing protein [Streptomyces albidus (ex Kaewkla and Franco 2022)]|uniref:DUF2267 domain-containing protein n=1 Tax=Streptomyces albidus (ex Kaewkla and Franco 2022) TaxID=722709 RepID=UPI0015EF93E6|nr:DUF2267 domain-containing protein [Streptomyces albidus (ex Kaewkla and Franco 2022)]
MRWSEFVARVGEHGRYASDDESQRVVRIVLSEFGGHLAPDIRAELAQRLPAPAVEALTFQLPVTKPLTASQFVDAVARRMEDATHATARWDVSSVLSAIAELCGEELTDRVLAGLPAGYALLFGRGELSPAA